MHTQIHTYNLSIKITFNSVVYRLGYEEFLQRFGLLLHAVSLPNEKHLRQPAQSAINQPRENKENELLFEPLDLLYRKQLNMTERRNSSTTPKKKLRRRAGSFTPSIFYVQIFTSKHHRRCISSSQFYSIAVRFPGFHLHINSKVHTINI